MLKNTPRALARGCVFDRIAKSLIEIRYSDIKKIEKGFIIVERDNKEANIPLHRIKKVERKGKLIWER